MYKRVLLLILCFVMVFFVGTDLLKQMAVADAASNTSIEQDQNDLQALKDKLNSIRNDKNNLEAEKNNASSEKQTLLQEKLILDQEYTLLVQEAEAISSLIAEYKLVLDDIEVKKSEAEDSLEKQLDDFNSLLVYMYKHKNDYSGEGGASKLKIFLKSESYSEYLSYVEFIEHLLSSKDLMVDNISATIDEIEEEKLKYDKAYNDSKEYEDKLVVTKGEIEAKSAEIDEKLKGLDDKTAFTKEEIAAMEQAEKDLLKEISKLQSQIQDKLDALYSGSFAFPLIGWREYRITSRFGWRTDPFNANKKEHHNGLDIACAKGTAIGAVDAGRVTFAGNRGAFGNVVFIEHGGGITTIYAHCDSLLVSTGDRVMKEQVIARVGKTGQSTGYHLHFAVAKNGNYVDPCGYLPAYYTRNYSYSR